MIKAIDFFCGAGGLTRGLLDVGIDVLAGVDNDESLYETYTTNNKASLFICEDINKVDIIKLRRFLGIAEKDAVLYAACTPCQPFSTLNRMDGEDHRRSLLLSFGRIVKIAPPDFILVENVPGLNGTVGKTIYGKFLKILADCGYKYTYADLLDAKDFSVPQVRKRFILIASRVKSIVSPTRAKRVYTVRSAIGKYPPILHGASSTKFQNHVARRLPRHHRRIVLAIPKNGGSRSDIKDSTLLLKCHRKKPKVHKDVFGRMSWDDPAPTLTCRCSDVYCGRFVHPSQNRGISLREAAAIQTFSDSYRFFGTFSQIARMIGNAVPVRLAKQLGRSIVLSHINGK